LALAIFREVLGLAFVAVLAADRPALALVTDRRLTVLVDLAIGSRSIYGSAGMQSTSEANAQART
jgi:hypothetical protein